MDFPNLQGNLEFETEQSDQEEGVDLASSMVEVVMDDPSLGQEKPGYSFTDCMLIICTLIAIILNLHIHLLILGVEGPISDFQPFVITIKNEEYKKIEDRVHHPTAKDERYQYQFSKDMWPHVFYSAFLLSCPVPIKGCKVVFSDHRFPKDRSPHSLYWCTAAAKCTRKGSVNCQMKFMFQIKNKPKKGQDVLVSVM